MLYTFSIYVSNILQIGFLLSVPRLPSMVEKEDFEMEGLEFIVCLWASNDQKTTKLVFSSCCLLFLYCQHYCICLFCMYVCGWISSSQGTDCITAAKEPGSWTTSWETCTVTLEVLCFPAWIKHLTVFLISAQLDAFLDGSVSQIWRRQWWPSCRAQSWRRVLLCIRLASLGTSRLPCLKPDSHSDDLMVGLRVTLLMCAGGFCCESFFPLLCLLKRIPVLWQIPVSSCKMWIL